MNLVRDSWKNKDIIEFQEYLKSYENKEKTEWTTNLIRTELPVLAMKSTDIKIIIEQIYKGNYLEFLDHMVWKYYENTAINGYLISKIKDFDTMKKYLDIYSELADNWATCDLLTFNVKRNEENFFNITLEYIKSEKPIKRRIGLNILFNFIDNDEYIDKIFQVLDLFEKEEEYYVNMINAWLLCECFIKQRNKTLKYLTKHKLNKFTINKAIQKCRDSRRITPEDKEMLLQFKIK